jgi:hypothetical protein
MLKTIWDISNEDFINIIKESKSYIEVLQKCGYTNYGNNKTIKKRIKLLNLSTKHFIKFIIPINKTISHDKIFIKDSTYNNNTNIKKILYKYYNWEYKCNICNIKDWLSKSISLELDHINGNNKDNRFENLRLLCPNCHSQTPTFRCKNITKQLDRYCINCINKIYKYNKSGYCKFCISKYRQKNILNKPSLIQLQNDLKELKTYEAVSKKYNVSDYCIRNWIKNYNKDIINNFNNLSI